MKITTSILCVFISLSVFAQSKSSLLNSIAALERNEPDFALSELNKAIDSDKVTPKILYYRGIANYYQKNYNLARADFMNAIEEGDFNDADLWIAKSYAIEKNAIQSVYYLDKYLTNNRTSYRNVIKHDAFLAIKETQEWNDFVSEFVLTDYEDAILNIEYLLQKGKSEEARKAVGFLYETESNTEIKVLTAKSYAIEGSYELAVYELNLAIEKTPENMSYRILLGDYLVKSKLYTRAIEEYETVLLKQPEVFTLYLKLADAYLANNESESAEYNIELYLTFFPENIEAIKLASDIYTESSNYQQALRNVNKLFATGNVKPEWFLSRGNIYFKTGLYKYSSEDLSMYLDLVPDDPNANFQLGNAHYNLGNKKLACYYWQRATRYGSLEAIEPIQKNCE